MAGPMLILAMASAFNVASAAPLRCGWTNTTAPATSNAVRSVDDLPTPPGSELSACAIVGIVVFALVLLAALAYFAAYTHIRTRKRAARVRRRRKLFAERQRALATLRPLPEGVDHDHDDARPRAADHAGRDNGDVSGAHRLSSDSYISLGSLVSPGPAPAPAGTAAVRSADANPEAGVTTSNTIADVPGPVAAEAAPAHP